MPNIVPRILVIEDEEPVRANLLDLLEAEGFSAFGAANGRLGVQAAQQSHPDLIICDIMMPELDGYEVLTTLRQQPDTATIPFIFLTAKTDNQRQSMLLGADDYLVKPYALAELLEAISVRLEKKAAFQRQSEQMLDVLRSNIAHSLPHELLTPLHVIMMAAEMLIEDYESLDPSQVKKMGERIHTSSKRLNRTIHNFLLYAELQMVETNSEKMNDWRSQFTKSSRTLITETVMQITRYTSRSADLQLDLTEASVQISDERLKKIVEELADNAFKYSKTGSPVQITSRIEEDKLILTIRDQGRGMTTEQITGLGAYIQMERKLYEQQGTGLGFNLALKLAQLHGGDLKIESQPDQYTLVTAILPLH